MLFFVSSQKKNRLFYGSELSRSSSSGFDSVMVRNVVWKVQYHAGSNMLELKIAKVIAGIARVKLARCTFK